MKNFKNGIENLPIFSTLHVQIGKIFKKLSFSNFDYRAFDNGISKSDRVA